MGYSRFSQHTPVFKVFTPEVASPHPRDKTKALRFIFAFFFYFILFSSPEPKAHGELIVYQSSRRPSVRPSVHTFKHDYLHNQQTYSNQILSEASFGWGKGCVMFWPDRIGTLVSMATDSSHRVIMGKILLAL